MCSKTLCTKRKIGTKQMWNKNIKNLDVLSYSFILLKYKKKFGLYTYEQCFFFSPLLLFRRIDSKNKLKKQTNKTSWKHYRQWHEQNAYAQVHHQKPYCRNSARSSRCVRKTNVTFCACEMCNTIMRTRCLDVSLAGQHYLL